MYVRCFFLGGMIDAKSRDLCGAQIKGISAGNLNLHWSMRVSALTLAASVFAGAFACGSHSSLARVCLLISTAPGEDATEPDLLITAHFPDENPFHRTSRWCLLSYNSRMEQHHKML